MGHTKSFFYIIRAWMIGILMLVMTGMFVYADIPVIETDVSTPSSGCTVMVPGTITQSDAWLF